MGGGGGATGPTSLDLQQRLKSLKQEFSELIGELRRRSSIVEGIAMSFEVLMQISMYLYDGNYNSLTG